LAPPAHTRRETGVPPPLQSSPVYAAPNSTPTHTIGPERVAPADTLSVIQGSKMRNCLVRPRKAGSPGAVALTGTVEPFAACRVWLRSASIPEGRGSPVARLSW
jgi:hypothetical protein